MFLNQYDFKYQNYFKGKAAPRHYVPAHKIDHSCFILNFKEIGLFNACFFLKVYGMFMGAKHRCLSGAIE